MRKNILTSAFILGSIGAYAGSEFTIGNTITIESSNGRQIEIMILEERPVEDFNEYSSDIRSDLIAKSISYEETLRVLNKIRKPEREVEEMLAI